MSSKILVVGHRNPDNDSIAAAVGYAHLKNALAARDGEADAVLAASVFHFGTYSIRQVKEYMASQGIPVRLDF